VTSVIGRGIGHYRGVLPQSSRKHPTKQYTALDNNFCQQERKIKINSHQMKQVSISEKKIFRMLSIILAIVAISRRLYVQEKGEREEKRTCMKYILLNVHGRYIKQTRGD